MDNPRPTSFNRFRPAPGDRDAEWFRIIQDGTVTEKGTGMPRWKEALAPKQIWQIITFLHSLPQEGYAGDPGHGKAIYEARCAFCHGVDGNADTEIGKALNPRPRNFTDRVEMAAVTDARMFRPISAGSAGVGH